MPANDGTRLRFRGRRPTGCCLQWSYARRSTKAASPAAAMPGSDAYGARKRRRVPTVHHAQHAHACTQGFCCVVQDSCLSRLITRVRHCNNPSTCTHIVCEMERDPPPMRARVHDINPRFATISSSSLKVDSSRKSLALI